MPSNPLSEDGKPLSRAEVSKLTYTSEATVDRARRSGALKSFSWNTRGVRIWSQDARDWFERGCPTILLVVVVGYLLLAGACRLGVDPAHDVMRSADIPNILCDNA